MGHQDLYERSIQIIKKNQSSAGSYIASPNFATYAYSWLRDGSYVAAAMSIAGEYDSARRFHQWVNLVVERYQHKIPAIRDALNTGEPLRDQDYLFTRYSLSGFEDMTDENWGNFQYDGYGTWLWSLYTHFDKTDDKELISDVWESVLNVLEYLSLVWRLPSYDCWEEHPDLLHPYSLACAYGGMQAALQLAEKCSLPVERDNIKENIRSIHAFTLTNGLCDHVLKKHIHPDPDKNPYCGSSIDSSLLGAIHPAKILPLSSQEAEATLKAIQKDLLSNSGGLYRYLKDTYYGGGTWILLTAWLGWVEFQMGEEKLAHKRLNWILSKVDENGWLPEQLLDEALTPKMTNVWKDQWGEVASPLLWSHAMYIILHQEIFGRED
ncbi:MAG: glycoside hydrolase family 15 protein [Brevefilum sp.]